MDYFKNDIICETLNNLEFFSMYFNYGIAEKDTVYQSLHKTYIDIVETLYYDIAINNVDGESKLYTNVIELYNDWKADAESQKSREAGFVRSNTKKGNTAKKIC